VLCHGQAGELQLGAEPIQRKQLVERAAILASWNLESIELYACHTGADAAFVQTLEQLSGAKVAASSGVVGHASLGGSWALQGSARNGIAPFSRAAIDQWAGTLAVTTPDLLTADDDGTLSTDNSTSVTSPTFTGTGPSSTLIYLEYLNGTVIGSGTSDANGNWSIQPSSPLALGSYTIRARYASSAIPMVLVGAGGATIPNQAIAITPTDQLYALYTPDVTNGYYLDLGSVASSGSNQADTFSQLRNAYNSAKGQGGLNDWGTFAGDAFEKTITGQSYAGTNVTYVISEGSNSLPLTAAFDASDRVIALTSDPNASSNASFITNVGNIYSPSSLSLTIVSPDTTPPTISSVAITSASGIQSNSLNAGDAVSVTVTMDEAVTVTGTPQLSLNIGGTTRTATYSSGSGTTALIFQYTIAAGDTDPDGISIGANSLALNGGTINDAAGNAATLTFSAVSDNASYLVDTTAPTVSSVLITSATGIQNSTLNAGDVVSVTVSMDEAVTVTGTPQLSLNVGGSTRTATYSSGSGTSALIFQYTIAAGDTDPDGISIGANSLALNGGTINDAAGNAATLTFSAVSDNASYLVDTTAPAAAVITTISTNFGDPNTSDTIINDASPLLTFTGEAGATVQVLDQQGNTVPSSSYTLLIFATTYVLNFGTNTQSDGIYSINLTDAAGNVSTPTTFTIDTTAPGTPAITSVSDDAALITGALTSGGLTNDTDLTVRVSLTGTNAVAGDTIQLYDTTTALGTAYTLLAADITNGYADVATGSLTNGSTYTISAKVIDIAGNTSAASGTFVTTVDTIAPAAPAITSVTDNVGSITGALTSGGRTNDTDLTVRVSLTSTNAAAGDTIQLYDSATALGTSYTLLAADITNGYADVPTGSLTDGTTYIINAKVIDGAGNASAASANFTTTVDTTIPGAPAITSVSDDAGSITGPLTTGGRTNDTDLTVRVSLASTNAVAGDTIQLYGTATALGSAYTLLAADITNGYADLATGTLTGGTTYTINAKVIDVAGNASAASSNFTTTVDTTAPGAPAITSVTDDAALITGALTSGGSTNDNNLTVRVSLASTNAVAGDTIQLYDTVTALGTAYTLLAADITNGYADVPTGTLTDGTTYTINAKVIDIAGNASSASANFTTTVDTTAPGAPAITSVTDDAALITGALTSGGRTNDTDLTVRVSLTSTNAVAGDTIQMYDSATTLGTAYTLLAADITNGFSDVATGTLTDATTYTINAKVIDSAGNASKASTNFRVPRNLRDLPASDHHKKMPFGIVAADHKCSSNAILSAN
jgi:hypothetical protein